MSETSYNLLTCDGTETFVSFTAFLGPFYGSIWCCLVVAVIVAGIYIKVQACRLTASDSAISTLLRIIFRQDISLSSILKKALGLEPLLCMLCLTILVPSFYYEGFLTADLTKPLPVRKLERIEEGVRRGFSILLPVSPIQGKELNSLRQLDLTAKRVKAINGSWNWFMINYVLRKGNKFLKNFLFDQDKAGSVRPDYAPMHAGRTAIFKHMRYNASVGYDLEQELSLCNQTMIVDEHNELIHTLRKLRNKNEANTKFYLGEDKYMRSANVFAMQSMGWDRQGLIYSRFHAVVHSGLMKYEEQRNAIRNFEEKEDPGVKPLSTSTNFILSTIVVYFAFVLTCIFTQFIEISRTTEAYSKLCLYFLTLV